MISEDPPEARCGYCRTPLPADTVSEYFCGQGHQDLWHRNRSQPLGHPHGKPQLTWDEQSQQIRATMAGLRTALTEFGQAARECGEVLNHLTDAAG
jgi:hypothetical protein